MIIEETKIEVENHSKENKKEQLKYSRWQIKKANLKFSISRDQFNKLFYGPDRLTHFFSNML